MGLVELRFGLILDLERGKPEQAQNHRRTYWKRRITHGS
jgi:hypothetical protein